MTPTRPPAASVSATAGRDALREVADRLRYIARPSMGLPSGVDPAEYARTGATEANVRAALAICIGNAQRALAALDGLPDTPTDEGPTMLAPGVHQQGLAVAAAYRAGLDDGRKQAPAPAARPETDEPLRLAWLEGYEWALTYLTDPGVLADARGLALQREQAETAREAPDCPSPGEPHGMYQGVPAPVPVAPSPLRAEQDAVHADLVDILRALGIGDHARTYSSHEVVQREVLPALRVLRQYEPNRAALAAASDRAGTDTAHRDTLRDEGLRRTLRSLVRQARNGEFVQGLIPWRKIEAALAAEPVPGAETEQP